MPTVRVTCPECEFAFSIADTRVGGLITCRDCNAEFRVEFAEEGEPEAEREERPERPAPRTRSRVDADHEPETWKTDLPLRSPVPLLLVLVGLQVLVAGFLLLNWFIPPAQAGSPTGVYYYAPATTGKR